MEKYDLTWLWTSLSSAATGIIGFFVARRKNNAEAQGSELDNVEKAVEIWREVCEGLKNEVEGMRSTIKSLQEEVAQLRSENNELKLKVQGVHQENMELKSQITQLKREA